MSERVALIVGVTGQVGAYLERAFFFTRDMRFTARQGMPDSHVSTASAHSVFSRPGITPLAFPAGLFVSDGRHHECFAQ